MAKRKKKHTVRNSLLLMLGSWILVIVVAYLAPYTIVVMPLLLIGTLVTGAATLTAIDALK